MKKFICSHKKGGKFNRFIHPFYAYIDFYPPVYSTNSAAIYSLLIRMRSIPSTFSK